MKKIALLTIISLLLTGVSSSQVSEDLEDGEDKYIVLHQGDFDTGKLEDLGAEIVFDYSIIDGAAIKSDSATAEQIESLSSVDSVEPDIPVLLPVMEGDGDDTDRDSHGGEGTVAILDTGVDDDHIDLQDQVVSHEDVRSDGNDPEDYHGHGTHVASILAGTGEGDSRYQGVAPNADIRNYKVLDDTGSGDMSDVIKGVEEASRDSDVIVLSLGAKVEDCDGTDPLGKAVDNAAEKGVSVVVAAGNEGPDGETITSPGCAEKAFTVGSSRRKEELSDFSSRGPTADGRVKPDIVAQGENIMAAEAQTRDSYTSKSGTSMSAPYIAGAVAVLMEEKDTANSEYYSSMTETAIDLDYSKNAQGAGNANITAAENHLKGSDAGNNQPGDGDQNENRNNPGESENGDTGSGEEVQINAGSLIQTIKNFIEEVKKLVNSIT